MGLLSASSGPAGQPCQPASKATRPASQPEPGSETGTSHQPSSQPQAISQSPASQMPTIIMINHKRKLWGAELVGSSRLSMAGHGRTQPTTAVHGCPRPPTPAHGWTTLLAFWASSGCLLVLFWAASGLLLGLFWPSSWPLPDHAASHACLPANQPGQPASPSQAARQPPGISQPASPQPPASHQQANCQR